MFEIVNGYICMKCCDVDKARMDEDPHRSTNQIQKELDRHIDKLATANFGPAVTFGGSLEATVTAGAADAVGTSQASQNVNGFVASSGVNLLV